MLFKTVPSFFAIPLLIPFSKADIANVERTLRVHDDGGYYYYEIVDRVNSTDTSTHDFKLNINGNGNNSEGTFNSDSLSSGIGRFFHPCHEGRKWGLKVVVSGTNPQQSTYPLIFDTTANHYHGNVLNGQITAGNYLTKIDTIAFTKGYPDGKHSRLEASQTGQSALFQTILIPYQCQNSNTGYFVKPEISNDHSSTVVYGLPPNNMMNLHVSKLTISDTITISNPYHYPSPSPVPYFYTTGYNSMLSISDSLEIHTGSCISYTHFRMASIDSGNYMKYNDTVYIKSNHAISCRYKFIGKYKYKGFVTAPSTGTTVTFCISDLDAGIPMSAIKESGGNLTVTYNDSTNCKYITVAFPVGTTNFYIQPTNPCSYDCYFPSIAQNINDTTFNANDKDLHTLGHNLTVLNHGLLHVTGGTRIDMCSGVFLRNRDSIIIEGPCQTAGKTFDPCSGISGLYSTDPSSAIIVSSGCALVLDSGSYTYLKEGGAIWVKQNGSLIIKNHAFVQIGDSPNFCGYGEIITELGAYVQIEPQAHIEFARTIGDTVDRNLFYVKGATAGVYSPILSVLNSDTVLNTLDYAVSICALDTINPVKNREWGMHPFPTYHVRRDTICPGELLCISLNRILNSDSTGIYVCRKTDIHRDSFPIPILPLLPPPLHQPYYYRIPDTIAPYYFHYLDSCIQDTFWHDSIPPGDFPCKQIHTVPDNICFSLKTNTLHRITIRTKNDCGLIRDTVGYVFVADSPRFSISLPDTICPGTKLTAHVTDINHQAGYYTFGIAELPDSLQLADIMTNPQDTTALSSYYESHLGYLPDTFTFSNFRINGNAKYAVSLAITNSCGTYSTYHYTTTVFGAKIKIDFATTYNNPVGPAAFQLNGIATGATSFSWTPTTYLTNYTTLNPVCTTSVPIQYVFTASNGTCTDRDTANITHNNWAYAGADTETCYNQNIMLGTDYTAAIFLGLVWHSANHMLYDPLYYACQSACPSPHFPDSFMHYMILHLGDYLGQPAIDNFRNNEDLRSAIFKDHGFISYYNNFMSTGGNLNSFHMLDSIIAGNTTLRSLIEVTYHYLPNSNFLPSTVAQTIFTNFNTWYRTAQDHFNISWQRLDGTSWTSLPTSNYQFNMVPNNTSDKNYRITVINGSTVEYDQVLVKRDSIITPQFTVAYIFDSTVIFQDISTPEEHMYRYSWNFGDGGHSTVKNPYHTFTHSDTSFIVCMTIRDSCGTYTKCDTLKIDSFYNMGLFGKTGPTKNTSHNDPIINIKQTTSDNYLSVNRPNPFSDYSIAEYVLADGNHNAEIRITTTLGSLVKTYKLTQNKGMILIDGSTLRDGIYYYTLIVDGSVVASKMMAVQK